MVVAFHAATLATGRALPLTRTGLSPVGTRQLSWRTKGRHFEASLILQAVCWYLRYPLSYRDIEEMFRERGLAVDHSTVNRWVLVYAPLIESRLTSLATKQLTHPEAASLPCPPMPGGPTHRAVPGISLRAIPLSLPVWHSNLSGQELMSGGARCKPR